MTDKAALLRNYLVSALNVLKLEADRTPIPLVQQERFVFEQNAFGTDYVAARAYRAFVRDRRMLLDSLPDAQTAATAFFEGSVYARNAHSHAPALSNADCERYASLLRDIFVCTFLEHYQSFSVTTEQFHEHLASFASVWQSERVPRIVTLPLLQFRAAAGINLDQEVSVAVLPSERKSQLWFPDLMNPQPTSPWEFATSEWAVIGQYDANSPLAANHESIMPKVARVLLALRLLKSGGVAAEIAYDTLQHEYLGGLRATTPQPDLKVGRDIRDPYELLPNEVPDLITLYLTLGSATVASQLKVVTYRFQQAYSRDRLEDRAVDLAIAMEAMLLYGAEKQKSRYLGLRGAILLSDVFDKEYSSMLLRELYSARSKIVHAGATLWELSTKRGMISRLGPDGFLSDAAQWARTGIRRCASRITAGETLSQIAKSLN